MGALRDRYPRLRAVGVDTAPPGAPAERAWEGVDFAFAHVRAGLPVVWPLGEPVIVRVVGVGAESLIADLDAVVAELRTLTGLALSTGEPAPGGADRPAPGEIRVLTTSPSGPQAPAPGPTTLSSAGDTLACGRVVLDGCRCAATSVAVPGRLRHGLGHALGLAHPIRPGHVMSGHRPGATWTSGDVAGLHRVGAGRR